MNRLLIIFLMSLLTSCKSNDTMALINCDDPCNGISDPKSAVVDPYDCHSFIICSEPGESHLCPDDKVPNITTKTCEEGECTTQCSGNCKLECHTDDAHIADYKNDAENCNIYYLCVYGQDSIEYQCPEDAPYFDSKTETCSNDKKVCCKGCTPQCPGEEPLQIADPADCRQYYLCINGGMVGPLSCMEGEIFNTTTNECELGSFCESLCQGTTTTTPGTPDSTTSSIDSTTTSIDTTTTSIDSTTTSLDTTTTSLDTTTTSLDTTTTSIDTTTTSIDTTTTSLDTTTTSIDTTTTSIDTTTTSIDTTTTSLDSTTTSSESTTITVTSTTPTGPTDPNSCLVYWVCTEKGNFRKCPYCHEEFFHCVAGTNYVAQTMTCSGNLVFNPIKSYPYCIYRSECPRDSFYNYIAQTSEE